MAAIRSRSRSLPSIRRLRRAALAGLLPLLTALAACAQSGEAAPDPAAATASISTQASGTIAGTATSAPSADAQAADPAATATAGDQQTSVAIFAGGCFWCMEPPYDKLPGVVSTISGYTGGHVANPTYEQVSAGGTGHTEAIKVTFDPNQVSYAKLLNVFWHNIDPVAVNRQFCDVGPQYRSGIFPTTAKQRGLAEASKRELATSGRLERPIATEITDATAFYPAEDYHQNYYEKNPIRYKFYRWNCGRDQRLEEIWGSQG